MAQGTGLPNLILRGEVYYFRKKIKGKSVWISTGKRTLPAARKVYHQLMADLERNGPPTKRSRVWTVSEWAESEELADHNSVLASTTRTHDDLVVGKFVKEYGHRRLDSITAFDIRRYFKKQNLAPTTVYVEMLRLSRFFKLAIKAGAAPGPNPFEDLPRPKPVARERVLTFEEQERLLKAMRLARHRRWLLFMLGTGLRISEVRRLTPDDIDWPRRTMSVFGKGSKWRSVPILPEVEPILREQLATGKLWPAAANATIQKWFKRVCDRAGVKGVTAHTLRHTFATRYLKGGGDIYVLSKILGHASVQTTEKTYAHLVAGDLLNRSLGIELGLGSKTGSSGKNSEKMA